MYKNFLGFTLALGFCVNPAWANDNLLIELNKLEDEAGNCRAYFLFRNHLTATFETFEMSLAVLNESGIIDRLLTINAAPLPATRTTLKLFEIEGTACATISEIIAHEIASCSAPDLGEVDCYSIVDLQSRSAISLVK